MAKTKLMEADEIAHSFNSVTERGYWKAAIAGTRTNPEVHFNSRSSMVQVAYRIASDDFTISFSKTSVAFGDFMASAFRSLAQIMTSLKAAGLPFATVVDEATVCLRLQYDPRAKVTTVHLAADGDDWLEAEALPFKVPERKNPGSDTFPVDGPLADL